MDYLIYLCTAENNNLTDNTDDTDCPLIILFL